MVKANGHGLGKKADWMASGRKVVELAEVDNDKC